MATRTAENVAAIKTFATLTGKPVMNDFYYEFTEPPDHGTLVTLLENFTDAFTEQVLPLLSSNWVGGEFLAYDMTTEDGANATNDSLSGVVGTFAGIPFPNNVTLAIARRNGLRGRAGNGRIFWPGLVEDMLETSNVVLSTVADAMVLALQTVDEAVSIGGGTPVILSFQRDHVVSSAATIYPIDTWLVVDRRIDTQRRRIRGTSV